VSERRPHPGAPGGEDSRSRRADRPAWLRVRYRDTPQLQQLQRLVQALDLHTVCQSASCPNRSECWSRGMATFMIAGAVCTRRCGFCDLTTGRPEPPDPAEPERVAQAVRALELRFAVITSVARDDLPDGGAAHFAATIRAIREEAPGCRVEVLVPDFQGSPEALRLVLEASPDVLNHNVETVERLQARVRPAAGYARSLELLARSQQLSPQIPTKSGIMLGLGETQDEIRQTLRDIVSQGCRRLTIGQYLPPSEAHLPVERYAPPEEFESWERVARTLGFRHVASAALVRSSYRADHLEAPSDPD
jgi:lipoic acid synthetase